MGLATPRGSYRNLFAERVGFSREDASSESFQDLLFKHLMKLGADGVPAVTVIDAPGHGDHEIRQSLGIGSGDRNANIIIDLQRLRAQHSEPG